MEMLFLLKFTKFQYAVDFRDKGLLFFNPAYKFYTSSHYSNGQYDPCDSHDFIHAQHLIYAPIIDETGPTLKYGAPKLLSESAVMYLLDTRNEHIPVCCFRIVSEDDIVDDVFKLDSRVIQAIATDFPDYDHFALVCFPRAFLDLISRKYRVIGESITYIDSTNPKSIVKSKEQADLEDKFPYMQMFQKGKNFEYQREFRLILPQYRWIEGSCLEIGPLNNLVIVGEISQLYKGYRIERTYDSNMVYFEFDEIE